MSKKKTKQNKTKNDICIFPAEVVEKLPDISKKFGYMSNVSNISMKIEPFEYSFFFCSRTNNKRLLC